MPRLKEKIKILHTPTTHEIFVCLSDMIAYSRLLLAIASIIKRELYRLMIDGIKYEKLTTGLTEWSMQLIREEELNDQTNNIQDDSKQLGLQIKELQEKIAYIRELLSSKQIEPADFREMKSEYSTKLERLETTNFRFENKPFREKSD